MSLLLVNRSLQIMFPRFCYVGGKALVACKKALTRKKEKALEK